MAEHPADDESLTALLGESRAEIDRIDEEILTLLARRGSVVDRVADVKKEHGLPVYHPAREEDVISRRRRRAAELGLDPDMAEDLFRRILRQSRVVQNQSLADRSTRPGATVLLVGGRGSMGRCLAGWFAGAGYAVRLLDREDWGDAEALCRGADLAVLAVPIAATGETARRLAPYLSPSCVLADITSVKSGPVEAMLAAHPGPVLGLHPMFGPTTPSLDKQIVVVTPGRAPEACRWVVDQLATWGAVVVHSTPQEHDRMMDVVQGLRHFATFSFGQFLCRQEIDLARTLEFSSPIYRLELGMVGRLFAQDPGLYADIIFSTPERRELLTRYAESLAANLPLLQNADAETFLKEFARVAEWFGPFSDQAIRESSFLIDKMIERF